jgi:8-oxo-dGTP diphosphatase
VLKDRPAWQKGRLNLVGGKVERGESVSEAACRELKEESGIDVRPHDPVFLGGPLICGHIIGNDSIIHCVKCDILSDNKIAPREGETEKVDWYDWDEVKNDPRLIPNLKLVIPLLHMSVTEWTVVDKKSSNSDIPTHEVLVRW